MPKRAAKPVGVAHNPQLGTVVVFDNGRAVRLVVGDHEGKQAALGWEDLPGFDVTPDADDEQLGE